MTMQRALLVFAENTDAMEDLQVALGALQAAPWKPNPPGVPFGSPQEQYDVAEVDAFVLERLRRSISRISFGGSVIVP